jgi:mono/diheme cytochrome c family protein
VWRILRWLGVLVIGLLLVIQLVPYGRTHVNPPVGQEPRWDRPETRALAARVCFDCHSNETVWPWYSHVAPISWLVQRDVDEGRRTLNFSEFAGRQGKAHESAKTVRKGEMPPWFYEIRAPTARLTAAERAELIAGLEVTFGTERAPARDPRRRGDDASRPGGPSRRTLE